MLLLLAFLTAYLIGSISSAIIACKIMGLPDPRTSGSGNPGATNVLRMAGKKLAALVLIGDVLKGVIPVLLAKLIGVPNFLLGWVALFAFLGHLFPVFFGFRGGKGVATGLGAVLVVSWPLGLALIATWLIIALLFRYSSLAAIMTAFLAPFYAYWLVPPASFYPILMLCLLLIIRHYKNIQNLWLGKEDKIGSRRSNLK